MKADTGLFFVALALSDFAMVLAAVNRDFHWCAAYGAMAIASVILLYVSARKTVPPREDRREDDPKGRIGA